MGSASELVRCSVPDNWYQRQSILGKERGVADVLCIRCGSEEGAVAGSGSRPKRGCVRKAGRASSTFSKSASETKTNILVIPWRRMRRMKALASGDDVFPRGKEAGAQGGG
ncbi:uncharacterized protein LOC123404562 isoform X2 [Hordeum vulgare subsp. vulgare]|uniref:uncharacterized protein LOC123404562 isoform X2 n=1 Tax=Hordeum vulgare subsp. vulgare TaxID=112509 RepID=UPI001D1A3E09|nr:uncharacterized protein LOC123404562 isoform X2 [Hordeum vulgare subsp. vulgare]